MNIVNGLQDKLNEMLDQLCESWNMPRYVDQAVMTKVVKPASPPPKPQVNAISEEEPTMKNEKLGPTQERVCEYLRSSGETLTTQEIAKALNLTANQVKHAVARLFADGLVLRTTSRPSKWHVPPQVVQSPPQGSTASLHGTMPEA